MKSKEIEAKETQSISREILRAMLKKCPCCQTQDVHHLTAIREDRNYALLVCLQCGRVFFVGYTAFFYFDTLYAKRKEENE